jgi:hypothetical protein
MAAILYEELKTQILGVLERGATTTRRAIEGALDIDVADPRINLLGPALQALKNEEKIAFVGGKGSGWRLA